MASPIAQTKKILLNEYKALCKENWVRIELDDENVLQWKLALMVLNPDSLYYGGYFRAIMTFPIDYPYSPPSFRFLCPLYHPNIYPDGRLCISILHTPGNDELSGESASERWSPIQGVYSVLISILSLLDDAEPSSPANVDAGVMLRKNKEKYVELVKRDVNASRKDIPIGFVMPTHESTAMPPAAPKKNDDDFWADSDNDDFSDFGGSDSDQEMSDLDGEDMQNESDDEEDD